MFELMVAAKLFLTTPHEIVGIDRAKLEARFGKPVGVGTDYVPSPTRGGAKDNVVTLDWPDLRVRLHVSSATNVVSLLGVTTTADVLKLDSPIHIGVDRGTVLRELGGPLYEDEDQLVYSLKEDSDDLPNDTVRFVFTVGRSTANFCDVSTNPNDRRFCNHDVPFQGIYKLGWNYPLP